MARVKRFILALGLVIAGCDLLLPGKGGEGQPCIGSKNLCEDGLNCVESKCISPKNCTPSCIGRTCGSDGCGGICGSCGTGQTCNPSGHCNAVECTPDCTGKVCGSDGCGGSCGTCTGGKPCNTSGQCMTGTVAPSSAKDITNFTILGIAGTVGTNTISLTVPYGTSLTSLTPTIIHTGASVNPTSGVAQNFSSPVVYTVTAADASIKTYTVTVTAAPSSAKDITSFTILGIAGTIGTNTISLTVPYGTSLTSLTPAIIHTGASVNPASGVARNFTSPVTYAVTAADTSTKTYTVTVTVASCVANCTGKQCGDDGCGGSCGSCASNEQCNISGQCECMPQFSGPNCDACASGTFGSYPNCFLPGSEYCLTSQCFSVPPTNQTKCYNETVEMTCPTAGQSFYGQDSQYSDNARTFTCYNVNGTLQNPCDGTADLDEVVTDSLTGLMWQRTWISDKTWQQALDYCDGLIYGGSSDWRLPNRFDLQSLVDYGRYSPSIDTTAFPGTTGVWFWSSNSRVGNITEAWYVHFGYGNADGIGSKTGSYRARCVRGGPSPSSTGFGSRFILSGTAEQVVTDAVTGLMWQKDYATGKTWQQALPYCESLTYGGFSDWRLPNVNELTSLVNESKYNPASDFPEMPSAWFWSSSSLVSNANLTWGVDFSRGGVTDVGKTFSNDARCVRLGP